MATRRAYTFTGSTLYTINCMPFSYTYFVFLKTERSDKIVFYIVFKTQRPFDTVF